MSQIFYRIRIRLIRVDPDPESKGSEYKCYVEKLEFSVCKTKFNLYVHHYWL